MMLLKLVKWLVALVLLAVVLVGLWLTVSPPGIIRVASGYSAKMVCSNVFIAGRDADKVLADDVQAPGHWLLKYIRLNVDNDSKTVKAALLGLFGGGMAVARDGLGCSSVPDGNAAAVAKASLPELGPAPPADQLWPQGNMVQPSQDPAVSAILDDPAMTGPSMRAVVVVKNGRIVAERYGEGFSDATPLLGWSMTKTVNAAIVGTAIKAGKMSLDGKGLVEGWNGDGRKDISLADMMAMSPGLEFNEDYGDVTDVTRMLYLEPDMAGFTASKPLAGEIGKVFNYSSGTSTLLSRLWQGAVGEAEALAWPSTKLFQPLGMTSAVMEQDENGTYVGSSYMYATARDWARFGQFLLQDGVWNGTEIVPAGFVPWMHEAAPASKGQYGRGQVWLSGPGDDTAAQTHANGIPADSYWALGHDGQSIVVIPSAQMVVVRLGLTPSKLNYRPQVMIGKLVAALP